MKASKIGGGFDTAVLTQDREATPMVGGAFTSDEIDLIERLFLISKDEYTSSKRDNNIAVSRRRKKRTINRKKITHNPTVAVNDKTYNVNAGKSGLYIEIIEPLIEQFQIAMSMWGRVLVMRFDLHQHYPRMDNKHITAFRKRCFQKAKRKYGLDKIGFCWVREQERAKAQHYHWVLFLDGNKIRHSSKINEVIKEAWEDMTGAHHMPVIRHPFHFVTNEQSIQDAIYRVSYLAKARGKGYRPKQVKDYQCSRMKKL